MTASPLHVLASIPSPSQGVWNLGPLPVRAYALAILAGSSWRSSSATAAGSPAAGSPATIADVAVWAVPFGIVGGRLYHVITDWQLYFGADGGGVLEALRIWDGGLGIWGAVAARRRRRLDRLPPSRDPAAAVRRRDRARHRARAGDGPLRQLVQPGALRPPHRPAVGARDRRSSNRPAGYEKYATFHPTFLYESLWCVARRGHRGLGRPSLHDGPRPGVRALRAALLARPRGHRERCASTTRTTSSASGSTCSPRCSSRSPRSATSS